MQLKRTRSGSISETALALFVFLVFGVFPLLNLLSLATGASVACLLAHETATRAASQLYYADALSAMQQEASAFTSTGLAKFSRLVPSGGCGNCGVDLYVVSTNYKTGGTQTYGPNANINQPIDGLTYIYEYKTVVTCNLGPMLNMSHVPGFSQVPGLGKPALISFSACRTIEHPDGLEKTQAISNTTVSGMPNFGPSAQPGSSGAPGSGNIAGGWNYPGIYQAIIDAGQTVVDSQVLTVNANSVNWVDTGLPVQYGNKIWIDSWANGVWADPAGSELNANGVFAHVELFAPAPPQTGLVDYRGYSLNYETLIGQLGSTATQEPPPSPHGQTSDAFVVGVDMLNFVPDKVCNLTLAEFYLGAATGTAPNFFYTPKANSMSPTGQQTVRVIITR